MISIPVHLFAFSDKRGVVRLVDLPLSSKDDVTTYEGAELDSVLDLVFTYGQNDIQHKPFASISVGDVVQLGNRYFMVLGCGWKKLSKEEFDGLTLPTSHFAYKLGWI